MHPYFTYLWNNAARSAYQDDFKKKFLKYVIKIYDISKIYNKLYY